MSDWQAFVADCSWFLQDGQVVQAGEAHRWNRTPVVGLPVLSGLLAEAELTPIRVDEQAYELLTWGPEDDRRGWLCRPPVAAPPEGLHGLHRQLLQVNGGIVERFGEPESWLLNQNEVWTQAIAQTQLAPVLEAYAWCWEQAGSMVPIAPQDHYVVAEEANGNLTIVHRDTGALLLFAPDHDFEGVTALPGSPEYSLMTIDEAPELASWIEACAQAWIA